MKFLSDILAKAGLTVDGVVTLNNTATGQTPNANDNSTKLATTAWVRTFVQPYSLPIASASVLGGIKVGSGLSINSGTGVLSVTGASAASIKSTQTFVVTEGQTVFTVTGGYTPGLMDVFVNGVYLSPNQITATNGTTFTINDPAATGDIVDVIVVSAIYEGATTTTDQLPEGVVNLYYTDARARAAISLTVTGTSGASTYNSTTGVLNVPTYTLAGLGGVVSTRTITINGVTYDLTANRSWSALPVGGTAGQLLAKIDGTDYNAQWINEAPAASYTSQLKHRVKAGAAINKGQAVYVTSADGTNMIVGKASNATEGTSSKTLGLLETTASANGFANVITEGLLAGLDTTGANAAGDPVWLGTDGNLIYGLVSKPSAPAHLVFIGVVTRRNANNGEIFVKVQNGFELGELHDYVQNGVQDNYVISYESSTSLYKPKSIATLLGYTSANAARSLTINGTSYDLTADRTWTLTTSNIAEGTNLYYTDTRVGTYLTANSYATQSYVSTQINNLVSGAPGLLDTLDELAAALGDDPNFATTVSTALSNRLRIDIGTQGLTSTQQGYGRTNLGLGSLATLSSVANAQITDVAWSKVTGAPAFITGYTEVDTLSSVTGRGSTTSTSITLKSASTVAGLGGFSVMGAGEFMSTGGFAGYFFENRSGGTVTSNSNWYGWYATSAIVRLFNGSTDIFTINGTSGAATFTGNISASNFSGSSSGTNTGDQTNISGNAVTVSQRDFSGDISTGGMGRFTGWYTGNAATGLAAEIGTSGGQVYIIAYNRQTSTYGTVNIEGSASTLRITGSTVNVVTGSLQQGGNQVWHAGNFIPSNYLPLSGGTVTGKTNIGTGGSTNGGIFNVTGGTDNQMNISHNSSWGLLLGYCNESSPTGYHGPNHAAIINVQDAPLHLGSNNSSVLRIVSTGASILGNTIIHAGNYNSYALPLSGGTMSGTPVFAAAWSNAGGDYTGITNPAYKVDVASGYWRVVYKGAHSSVSGVYNFESGKNVYWGEPTDTGDYVFRGRSIKWAASNGTEYTVWNSSNLTNLNQLSNGPGYITSYSETDTLATVVGRGNTTGSNIITSASMYANTFYDYYDNGYYFQGRGVSRMYGIAIRGDNSTTGTDNQIFFWGAGNTTTSAIGFKANGGSFGNPTGYGDGYNTYLTMDTDGRGWVFRRGVGGSDFSSAYTAGWILNNGVAQFNSSVRSPIFYDSDNLSYYLDPNSNSRLLFAQFDNIGVGQAYNSGYRIITSGDIYLNAQGNGWAEGVWKQRRGGGTYYDVIDAGNYAGYNSYSNLYTNTLSVGSDCYAEKVFDLGYFSHGVANIVAYIDFGNIQNSGYLEVEVNSTYSNQNATGLLRKILPFGTNVNGGQWYSGDSKVQEANGSIPDNIFIGDLEWSGSNFRLPIYHVVSSGNAFRARVKYFTQAGNAAGILNGASVSTSTRTAPANWTNNPAFNRAIDTRNIKMFNNDAIGWRYSTGDSVMYNSISSSYDDTGYGITYRAGAWTSSQGIVCHRFQTQTSGSWQSRLVIYQDGVTHITSGAKIAVQNGSSGGTDRGIWMWTAGDPNWVIYMATGGATSPAGGTTVNALDGSSSHAIRYRIYSGSGNSHIWENHGETCLMSLNGNTGNLSVKGKIVLGTFPNSTGNSGEAWIGRATDRNQGTMTVQLGGGSASSRSFEVVDYAWSVVLFSVGSNGNVTASGDITAYSDRRIKENITSIDNAINKVKALSGVYYNRTDVADKSKKIGFIAQDVQLVVPELVNYDKDKDVYSVSYANTSALLVEAIKEQQTQIESQKSEIEELKDLVKQLINR